MAKKTIIINRFDGGIANDIREQAENVCAFSRHFDIFSNPNRLTPYDGLTADTTVGGDSTALKAAIVRNFLLGTNGTVYGLGQVGAGDDDPKIWSKSSPPDGAWAAPANGEDSSGTVAYNLFIEYDGYLFLSNNSTGLKKYGDIAGTPTFDTTGYTLDATPSANGIIGRDGNLYIPCGRYLDKIASDFAASPTFTKSLALTLPDNYTITNLCRWGKFLAITAEQTLLPTLNTSRLYLYDYVANDVSEVVELGQGAARICTEIDGAVFIVINTMINSAFSINKGKLVIKRWDGGTLSTVKILQAYYTSSVGLKNFKVEKEGRVFFYADVPQASSSTAEAGIYSFGRRDASGNYALTLDTGTPPSEEVYGMGAAGNYWYIAHNTDGSVSRTSGAGAYSYTSSYETIKFNGGDINTEKRLLGVAVSTAYLPANARVVLKYKKDSDTSFSTISTHLSTNSVSREDIIIATTGSNLPEFKEIQFRIESTGGAEITSLKFKYEEKVGLLDQK